MTKEEGIKLVIESDVYDKLFDYHKKFRNIDLSLTIHYSFNVVTDDYSYWFTANCGEASDLGYIGRSCTTTDELIKNIKKEYNKALRAYNKSMKGK
jgi:hypothetical protein